MDWCLYNAVTKGDVDGLRNVERRLNNVGDQRTPTNNTVLHLACRNGSIECVKEILQVHESLLLEINSNGETALYLAARRGHCEVVEALIAKAKSLDQQRNNHPTSVQILIRTATVEFETALHAAVRCNRKDLVRLLVREDPSHRYLQNKYDETPLYLASLMRYTDIMTTILEHCESPTFGGPDGRTALHAVVLDDGGLSLHRGFDKRPRTSNKVLKMFNPPRSVPPSSLMEYSRIPACVKLLLDNNPDLAKVADNYGWTVFHYIACNNLDMIVKDLVDRGRYVAYQPNKENKKTALHVAACRGTVDVIRELLKYFPDSWEIVDGRGRNILHMAVEHNQKQVITYILSEVEACKNLIIQRDNEGNTPLHLVAQLGCYVEELMDLKFLDWEVVNNRNLNPLDILLGREATTYTPSDEAIKRRLIRANVKYHGNLWRALKGPDIEAGNSVVENEKVIREIKEMINTHMIVAALITTAAITAGFAVPGGFNQGSPILLKKKSFQAFIVSDILALFFSIMSLISYYVATMNKNTFQVRKLFNLAVIWNFVSITAMLIAFTSGVYSVLENASSLATGLCVVSSFLIYGVLIMYGEGL